MRALIAWLSLLLAGCPRPGHPGYRTCDPYEPRQGCVLWLCYEVITRNDVERWVEWGKEGSMGCGEQDPQCNAAIAKGLEEACPGVDLDCRADCCAVCGSGAKPCGDRCIIEEDVCEDSPGCACAEAEACE